MAFALRLIGLRTGLPYVYNADENSHFVPRAVGMFGHGFNPHYFVNPPAFTYVVHFLYVLRYGLDPASIGGAYAADPTGAFTIARAASAFFGAAAVPLTAIAGARLFEDRRTGFVAGALLAVAFLPVHYSHFALNDAPTLAPLALCLVGVAGIYRTGRTREYVLAAAGLGHRHRDEIHGRDRAGDDRRRRVRLARRARARPQPGARPRGARARLPGVQPVRAAGPPLLLDRRHPQADRGRR